MEATCNNYISKLSAIQTACADSTTNTSSLTTLVNDLITIKNQFDTDTETMVFPTTVSHLSKFCCVMNDRSNLLLQNCMYTLLDTRIAQLASDTSNNIGSAEDRNAYAAETQNVKNYIRATILSCPSMSGRINVITKTHYCTE